MTKTLRKRHLQIWSMLLVLLPAGIIGARLATPKQPINQLLQPAETIPYPFIVRTTVKENYTVNLRKANDSSFQLEWINKNTLAVPTATIYKVAAGSMGIRNAILIGRIEARGSYRFPLGKDFKMLGAASWQLLLYDFIHQQVIDTIQFKN